MNSDNGTDVRPVTQATVFGIRHVRLALTAVNQLLSEVRVIVAKKALSEPLEPSEYTAAHIPILEGVIKMLEAGVVTAAVDPTASDALRAILAITGETHRDCPARDRPYTALSQIDRIAREGLA